MWIFYGLLTSSLRAALTLTQEKINMQPILFALWTKIICVLFVLPIVIYVGLPTHPMFYVFTFINAVIWSFADVIMWRQIPLIGAGVFSRTIPLTVIISFLLWFVIEPSLIPIYLDKPIISALIFLVLCLSSYFTIRMKKCKVTNDAFRKIWFVMFAFVMGPILIMLASKYAPQHQGPWAFVLFEALCMISMWFFWIFFKKDLNLNRNSVFNKKNISYGIFAGILMATMVITLMYGMYHTDNPGYILALISLEGVFVSIVHKVLKKRDNSDIYAGLGLISCVVILVFLKGQI